MKRLLQVLALLLCLILPSRAADQAPQKWALLIGIDTYQNDAMSQLRFSVSDTKAMRDAVIGQGYPADNVFAMTSDATGTDYPSSLNVLKRLSALGERIGPKDTFLFYFSGHGFQGEYGHFLATGDADPQDAETLERTTLPLSVLKSKMAKISAQNSIFIIDACRDNPEKGSKGAPNTMSEGFSKDLRLVAKSSGSEAGGLSGSAILLSCQEGQRSWEWDEKNHGVFTYFLVEGLNGAVKGANGQITMADLGDYVQTKVANWSLRSLKKQTPDMQQFGAAKIVVAQSSKTPVLDSLQLNIPTDSAPATKLIPAPAYWPNALAPLPLAALQNILRENGAFSFLHGGEANWGMMRVQSFDEEKNVLRIEIRQRNAPTLDTLGTQQFEVWTAAMPVAYLDANSVQVLALKDNPNIWQVEVSTRSKTPIILSSYDPDASFALNGKLPSQPMDNPKFALTSWSGAFANRTIAQRFADELRALILKVSNAPQPAPVPQPAPPTNAAAQRVMVTAPQTGRNNAQLNGEIQQVLDELGQFESEAVSPTGQRLRITSSTNISRIAGGFMSVTVTQNSEETGQLARVLRREYQMPVKLMNPTVQIWTVGDNAEVHLLAPKGVKIELRTIGVSDEKSKPNATEIVLPMKNRDDANRVANLFSELIGSYQ